MSVPLPPATSSNPETEYAALREELLNRLSSRQQILSISLTLAGAFSGIGWTTSAVVLLMYPLIALLVAMGWAQNEVKIQQIRRYIREHLEPRMPGFGWETFSRKQEGLVAWVLDVLSVGSILFLTQLLAFGLGIYQFSLGSGGESYQLIQTILLIADILAGAAMLWLMNYVGGHSR